MKLKLLMAVANLWEEITGLLTMRQWLVLLVSLGLLISILVPLVV